MPLLAVEQQSILGDFFGIIILPFRIVFKAIVWIFTLIVKIILFPLRFVWTALRMIFHALYPEIYFDNISNSFYFLLCLFKGLLAALTLAIIVLLLINLPILFILNRLPANVLQIFSLNEFDLVYAIKLVGLTFASKEFLFILLCFAGFLVSFVLVAFLITGYTFIGWLLEQLKFLWSNLLLLFIILLVAALEYLVLLRLIEFLKL